MTSSHRRWRGPAGCWALPDAPRGPSGSWGGRGGVFIRHSLSAPSSWAWPSQTVPRPRAWETRAGTVAAPAWPWSWDWHCRGAVLAHQSLSWAPGRQAGGQGSHPGCRAAGREVVPLAVTDGGAGPPSLACGVPNCPADLVARVQGGRVRTGRAGGGGLDPEPGCGRGSTLPSPLPVTGEPAGVEGGGSWRGCRAPEEGVCCAEGNPGAGGRADG